MAQVESEAHIDAEMAAATDPRAHESASDHGKMDDSYENHGAVSGEQFIEQENLRSLYSQQADAINPIEIQRRIIAKPKNDKGVSIAKKFMYDTVGSNGIFQASPSVIKFAGFETNKTHTMKLKLINNSPAP